MKLTSTWTLFPWEYQLISWGNLYHTDSLPLVLRTTYILLHYRNNFLKENKPSESPISWMEYILFFSNHFFQNWLIEIIYCLQRAHSREYCIIHYLQSINIIITKWNKLTLHFMRGMMKSKSDSSSFDASRISCTAYKTYTWVDPNEE